MPSGYTADIYEGKNPSMADFILNMARGYGAFIMQRDDGPGLPRKRTVADYTVERVPKAQKALEEWMALSLDDRRAKYDEYVQRQADSRSERKARNARLRRDYDAMAAQVADWDAPEIWQTLKKDAIKALEESKEFDAGRDDSFEEKYYSVESFDDWVKSQSEHYARDVKYAVEELAKETVRCQQQNEYTEQLYTSLGLDYNTMVR